MGTSYQYWTDFSVSFLLRLYDHGDAVGDDHQMGVAALVRVGAVQGGVEIFLQLVIFKLKTI